MRNFDIQQQFAAISKSATDALKEVFPVEGKLREIRLERSWVEDKLDPTDYADQSKAKLKEGTWGAPVYATLVLIDKSTGKAIDRADKVKLFTLPKPTARFSYIVGGNEYQVHSQLRLKPGVYTLRKQDGELKTQINLARGKNFDLGFNERTGVFTVQKIGGGQANIPLYPLLTHLGVSPSLIASAWGSKLESANRAADPKAVARAEQAFGLKKGQLKDYLDKTVISSETTKLVLGQGFERVDGPMLLAASKNLLDTHLGKKEPIDRDSLAFKELHSIEDYLEERLSKNKQSLAFKLKRNIDNVKRTKLTQIVNPGAFNSVIENFFTQDDKSATPEQTNPLEMLSGQYKVTIMGSGGIKSEHAITPEMREIHPSHYGFLDPVHTPECFDGDTEVLTKDGWKRWKEVAASDQFACRVDGRLEFHCAESLHQSHYRGMMYAANTGKIEYLVTPNHRMLVRPLDSAPEAWRIELAERTHNRPRTFCTTHAPYEGGLPRRYPLTHVAGSNASINVDSVDIGDWCEFMGWFLSEGHAEYDEESSNYRVTISQCAAANPEKCARIEALLRSLPWNWCQTGAKRAYVISTKQLAWHLKDQGYCDKKFIPHALFSAPVDARQRLLEALLLGDGRIDSKRATGVRYKQKVFTTTSKRLADGFALLATGLGHSVRTSVYKDSREARYLDVYEVRLLQRTIRSARKYNHRRGTSDYAVVPFDGMVYCATVPGGLLYVRRNGSVPIWLGNSKRIGANLHLPLGAVKDGKQVKMVVRDLKGAVRALSPTEAFEKKIAFPAQTGTTVKALYQGKVIEIKRSEIDFVTPNPSALFSWSTNLIPFLPSNQGNRAMMASKMLEQAIALKHREAPLVQVQASPGTSMEQTIGSEVAVKAPEDGVVKKVTPDHIILKTAGGDRKINLYSNFALNRKSFLDHQVKVKVGQRVKKGDLLADSNYTKDGVLALGTNMRVAYLPYKGLNFEDGIVVTESAAKRLTSEHIHKKQLDLTENHVLGLTAFKSFYPNALTPENLGKLGPDGVVKKGSLVRQGEAIVAVLQKRSPSANIATISKVLADRPKDASVYWTLEDSGVVLDVQKAGSKIVVSLKTEEPAKIGDKLSGRMGNKGIITKIIADHEAPHSSDGKSVDILLNPHGVISRINIGQIYESAAGKVAKRDGKAHVVSNFSGENYLSTTKKLLEKAGISDKEELFDPKSGKSLGQVHVGNPYILKLFKQGTVNFSVRQGGPGNPYDANLQPLKAGGEEGAKAMDLLTVYSMLAHGARANLREMSSIKSSQNDEFWKALKSGQALPAPKAPFVYDKFIGYLKGAGIDVKKVGSQLQLAPLTDDQVRGMSSGEVKKPLLYRGKDMEPVKGGFFDPVSTGGFKGTKWTHIELKEPVVNPVFEGAVRKLTGLGAKFDELMAGKLHVSPDGSFNTDGKGVTGGAAVEKLLKKIDVDRELEALLKRAPRLKGAELDDANKRMRYLTALKENKLTADKAYMRRVLPVVPPQFRPIYPLPDGNVTTSDVNILYQNTGVLNTMMKLPVMDLLPESEKSDIRKDFYDHVKGVSGLSDLNIKGRVREGFISEIKGGAGGQPKQGYFISKMLSKKQDFVGRGTIIPEPDLGLDEMAMPEEMAWKLFEPFVVRELKNHGKTPLQAKQEIKDKTALAKKALEIVMGQRHVLLNRAPSLHKFSIMAFKPKITSGRAIKIPPLVVKGFNADFDGDTMTVHVPITEEANREAAKMTPSLNLFAPGTGRLMVAPSQEAQIGTFYLSKDEKGRALINKVLGPKFAISQQLDKKQTAALLQRMAKEMPGPEFAKAVAELKRMGEQHAYDRGFSLGLDDLADLAVARDKVVAFATSSAKKKEGDQAALSQINQQATKLMDSAIEKKLAGKGNALYDMVHSGARGDRSQLRSIVATPLFMSDTRGRVIPSPIKNSYAEGLDVGDYWISMYGARRGGMERSIQTSLPGAFSKDIMATTLDNVVAAQDCGTKDGISLPVDDADALDRLTAGDQPGVAHNTVVDSSVVSRLKKAGAKEIKVRSPLTCHTAKGTCAKCHGLDEHGELPEVGENVGVKAGQTISEPLVQMVMNSRHTGGVAGTGAQVGGYQRIDQLLRVKSKIKGASPLSPKQGTITKIEKGLAGGFNVWVDDKPVHIPSGLELRVQKGERVAAGDALAHGVIQPQDLVKHKGMMAAQTYIVDELAKTYQAQGVGLQKRVFETVVRSLGNTTQVLNNPKHSGYLPGDVVPYTVVQAHNRSLVKEEPVDEAEGDRLAENVGSLRKGHVLTAADLKAIKSNGVKTVKIEIDPIVHAPFLKGMTTLPLLRRDWMSPLGYRYLSKSLVEGASQGWKTDLAGEHPIPAIAHGATFGQGKDGKY